MTVVGGVVIVDGVPATAASFTVINVAEDGPGSLDQAIKDANANPGPDVVTIAPSVSGQILLSGELRIGDDLTIAGNGAVTLTNPAGDVLYLYNGTGVTDVTVSNLSITDSTNGISVSQAAGRSPVGNLTLDDVTITGNTANGVAFAGPFDTSRAGNLRVVASTISGNGLNGVLADQVGNVTVLGPSTFAGNGTAASSNGMQIVRAGTLEVTDAAFDDNIGGGLFVESIGKVDIDNVSASRNALSGISIQDSTQPTTVTGSTASVNTEAGIVLYDLGRSTVIDSTIAENTGGGLSIRSASSALVEQTSITENSRGGVERGGGLALGANGPTSINDVTVSANAAAKGGGIVLYDDRVSPPAANVEIRRTTVSGNDSTSGGAAIYASLTGALSISESTIDGNATTDTTNVAAVTVTGDSAISPLTFGLTNSTVSGNGSDNAPAVRVGSVGTTIAHSTITDNGPSAALQIVGADVTLDHTVLSGNAVDLDVSGTNTLAANHSLLGTAASGAFPAGTGNVLNTDDPQVGALGNNGGSTRTHLPTAASPAVDAGNVALGAIPETDQRGAPRKIGTADIGAVEVLADKSLVVTTISGALVADGQTSLPEAVAYANAKPGLDTVTFQAGVAGTITPAGRMNIIEGLTIDGPGRDVVTVTTPTATAFRAYQTDQDIAISSLTISGSQQGVTSPETHTGKLTIDDVAIDASLANGITLYSTSELQLTATTITDSTGFGLDARTVGTVDVDDVSITGSGSKGIGIYGAVGLTVDNSTVSDNSDNGIFFYDVGAIAVDGSTFENNRIGIGGYQSDSVDVSDTTVSSNAQFGLDVQVDEVTLTDLDVLDNGNSGISTVAPVVTITRATVAGNGSATSQGGGIKLSGAAGSSATIDDSTIADNNALQGGGIWSSEVDLTAQRSTVSGNDAVNANGGVHIADASLTMINATLTANSASLDGSAIGARQGTVDLRHSTVSDNTSSGSAVALHTTDSATSLEHTILSGNQGDDFVATGTSTSGANHSLLGTTSFGQFVGGGNVSSDTPALGTLGANGGLTRTMLPQPTSPALEAGNAFISSEPATDQRGSARIENTIDIGAVEVDHGVIDLTPAIVDVAEGSSSVQVTVTRSAGSEGAATVDVQPASDTAMAGLDFDGTSQTVSWANGESGAKTVTIPIIDDQSTEPLETFTVSLVNPVGIVLGPATTSTIRISDGDVATAFALPLAPRRFLDTRPGQETLDDLFDGEGRRPDQSLLRLQVAGRGSVPDDAAAAIVNITAVNGSRSGFITVFSCDDDQPVASSLNFGAGVNIANEIITDLSASGEICIFTSDSTHLLADVVAYIPTTSAYAPVTPARLLETRPGQATVDGEFAGDGKRGAGQQLELDVIGRGNIPAAASAVVVNVTSVGSDTNGFITVHPCLPTVPTASSLNYTARTNRANEVIAELSADGTICLFNSDPTHLLVDVVGWLPANAGYTPVAPARLADTRANGETTDDLFEKGGRRLPGSEYRIKVADRANVPAGATSAVVNIVAIAAQEQGFITVYNCEGALPTASSLNYVAGVNGANELVAGLNAAGELCVFTSGNIHLALDVVGYSSD